MIFCTFFYISNQTKAPSRRLWIFFERFTLKNAFLPFNGNKKNAFFTSYNKIKLWMHFYSALKHLTSWFWLHFIYFLFSLFLRILLIKKLQPLKMQIFQLHFQHPFRIFTTSSTFLHSKFSFFIEMKNYTQKIPSAKL